MSARVSGAVAVEDGTGRLDRTLRGGRWRRGRAVRQGEERGTALDRRSTMTELWYAAYGSNLARHRFVAYLSGGRPVGANRTYPGARDPRPPAADRPLLLPGSIFFAWTSPTWGGGIAFYDAESAGTTYARAYRITHSQFSDLAAQEMRREPGTDLDLTRVLAQRRHSYGPGRYETLHLVGELDGLPVLTFTAPADHGLPLNPPTAAYVAMIRRGLRECHGLSDAQARAYLTAAGAEHLEF